MREEKLCHREQRNRGRGSKMESKKWKKNSKKTDEMNNECNYTCVNHLIILAVTACRFWEVCRCTVATSWLETQFLGQLLATTELTEWFDSRCENRSDREKRNAKTGQEKREEDRYEEKRERWERRITRWSERLCLCAPDRECDFTMWQGKEERWSVCLRMSDQSRNELVSFFLFDGFDKNEKDNKKKANKNKRTKRAKKAQGQASQTVSLHWSHPRWWRRSRKKEVQKALKIRKMESDNSSLLKEKETKNTGATPEYDAHIFQQASWASLQPRKTNKQTLRQSKPFCLKSVLRRCSQHCFRRDKKKLEESRKGNECCYYSRLGCPSWSKRRPFARRLWWRCGRIERRKEKRSFCFRCREKRRSRQKVSFRVDPDFSAYFFKRIYGFFRILPFVPSSSFFNFLLLLGFFGNPQNLIFESNPPSSCFVFSFFFFCFIRIFQSFQRVLCSNSYVGLSFFAAFSLSLSLCESVTFSLRLLSSLKGFRDLLLKPELLQAIADCGFEHPVRTIAGPLVMTYHVSVFLSVLFL